MVELLDHHHDHHRHHLLHRDCNNRLCGLHTLWLLSQPVSLWLIVSFLFGFLDKLQKIE